MKDLMRDELEKEILMDGINGDTTVLADLLSRLSDEVIFNALSDEAQERFKKASYTVKVWHTEEDYNQGNSKFDCTVPNMAKAISYAEATLLYVYAVEVYETESGETVWHSEEG